MVQALPDTQTQTRPTGGWSVPFAWLLALTLYAIAVYGGLVADESAMWVTDLSWTLSAFVAVFGSFRAAHSLAGHLRVAWVLFGVAFCAWLIGQLIWDWQELVKGVSIPFPSASDIFFITFGIISIGALFAMRNPSAARRLTTRDVGNLGLIICSLAVATITALLEPISLSNHSTAYVGIALAEAMSIVTAFVFSVYFLWSHRWGAQTATLVLIVVGFAVHAALALLYIQSLIASEFGPSHYLNIGWIAAMGFQHWASCEQVRALRRGNQLSSDTVLAYERRVEALLPGLLLLALVIAAAAFHTYLTPRVLQINVALLGLFAIILLARESWIYARERQLKAMLEQSNSQIDRAKQTLDATSNELSDLEETLRIAALAGNVGMFERDLRTDRVYYSAQWKRQLGYDENELSDTLEEWRSRVHPDDYERVMACIEEVLNEPGKDLRLEHRLRDRNGKYRWFLSQGSVKRDSRGTPLSILGSHVDITRLKQTEEALRDSEARYRDLATQLELRVSERTAQLRDAYTELEGFAYAVSHDLKAPLRAIDGFSHILTESAKDRLSPIEQDYITRLRHSALRMAALIDGLLAYSRVERRELNLGKVDARALLHEILAEQEPLFATRHLIVNCDVPDLTLHVDREALSIVLRNLLDNAVKFTRNQPLPKIDIRAKADEKTVTIEVCDNGIGFDPAFHDQIFNIFQRLHADGEYEGTGIGLALARKAVQRMNGRLWAESTLGAGAKFFVELPRGSTNEVDEASTTSELTSRQA